MNASDDAGDDSATFRVARFVRETQWDDLPPHIRALGIRCLINAVGNSLGGVQDFAIQRLLSTLRPLSGPPQAVVIGRHEVLDRASASFINAASANVLDFDDTHFPTVIHPTAVVFAPLLALSQQGGVSGRDFLTALVLGIELACRLGLAVSPGHYRRGAHVTATCGIIAAAAVSGRILRLDLPSLISAMGIAASRAGGLVENLGSAAKSVSVGAAARDGLLSATFAGSGLGAAPDAIEGPGGFLAVASKDAHPAPLVDNLGHRWEIENNALKAYPCGVVLGPVIDAALQLSSKVDEGRIARIVVTGHPLLIERANRADVLLGREAKLSIQHSVACALLTGRMGVEEFSDAAVSRPDVRRLRQKVTAMAAPGIDLDGARIEVHLTDGGVLMANVEHARGSPASPLDNAALNEKFIALARLNRGGLKADRLLQTLWQIESLQDMRAITRLCSPE